MANRLFLVCSAHPEPENALCLGERGIQSALYEPSTDAQRLARFFKRHETCGTGPDHYQLAHRRPQNHDVATPQSSIGPAVRLALVSDGGKLTVPDLSPKEGASA